jgi:putative Ca2+/H+ antiporter (TMEM165/GDT1 family)
MLAEQRPSGENQLLIDWPGRIALLARLYFSEVSMRELMTMFFTIFVAELGDKTQLATLLFASEKKVSPLTVFLTAASALVIGTAIAVLLGTAASRYMTAVPLKLIAGIGFVLIGAWTITQYFRG